MRRSLIGIWFMLTLGCAQQPSDGTGDAPISSAERSSDDRALQAELLVARDLLQRSSTGPVTIDSNYAAPGQAPPFTTGEIRPPGRTRSLHDSLGLDQASADMFIIRLSEPAFDADSARITATIDFPSARQPGGRGYETVEYTLEGGAQAWTIRRRVQLGIT
jgi:hypothetical protein